MCVHTDRGLVRWRLVDPGTLRQDRGACTLPVSLSPSPPLELSACLSQEMSRRLAMPRGRTVSQDELAQDDLFAHLDLFAQDDLDHSTK